MISRKDAVIIASRMLAVYFFAWSIDNATYLPGELVNIFHHAGEGSVVIGSGFWLKYYSSILLMTLMRVVLLAGAGWFFYKCDSDIQAFLLPVREVELPTSSPTQ
ncbi:MAG: hypothetical protein WB421_05080 [Terriglobales bacterium]|jgi:hypothetical protein